MTVRDNVRRYCLLSVMGAVACPVPGSTVRTSAGGQPGISARQRGRDKNSMGRGSGGDRGFSHYRGCHRGHGVNSDTEDRHEHCTRNRQNHHPTGTH